MLCLHIFIINYFILTNETAYIVCNRSNTWQCLLMIQVIALWIAARSELRQVQFAYFNFSQNFPLYSRWIQSVGSSSKSIYYILGQQNGPPGKFPPGWDLTLRGMVVGEVRRITLPPSLAYDRRGDKLLNIPPLATLVYTVKLVSIT